MSLTVSVLGGFALIAWLLSVSCAWRVLSRLAPTVGLSAWSAPGLGVRLPRTAVEVPDKELQPAAKASFKARRANSLQNCEIFSLSS